MEMYRLVPLQSREKIESIDKDAYLYNLKEWLTIVAGDYYPLEAIPEDNTPCALFTC